MRTPCSPRIAPCDLCEPLKKHRRRKDMQREPKAQRGSSKDYASASNARPRSDDRNSRPEGKTSPRRRGRIPTRNKPSRRTQGMPQPPPCARKRIRPTTPGQSTLSSATRSPRRRHGAVPRRTRVLPHILAGVPSRIVNETPALMKPSFRKHSFASNARGFAIHV